MIYFDYSSAQPVDPRVIKEMVPCLRKNFGNPSSHHKIGIEARNALNLARDRVSELIGAKSNEIVFTANGTEADNLAIKGLAQAMVKKGQHIVVSSIEHHAVLYAAKALARHGFVVTQVPVDLNGIVQPEEVARAIRNDTVLVSVMLANDQTGTIQPIRDITDIARKHGAVMHTDAVSVLGRLSVNVNVLKVDALSVSARTLNGPPGAGALYLKTGIRIRPQLEGGIQEEGRRGGYENIPAIVGFGKAAELMASELNSRLGRLKQLDEFFCDGLMDRLPNVSLNGHPQLRLPGHLNLWIKGVDGESLALILDEMGIAVSIGSSCESHAFKPSHVLLALGRTPKEARCSLLVSMNPETQESEINEVLDALVKAVQELRGIAGVPV
mgnify:CR=1 FL=1